MTCKKNQKRNNKTYLCECKNYHKCKKIVVGILSQVLLKRASI